VKPIRHWISNLENRPVLSKILKSSGWLFFDRFFRLGVSFIVGLWVARYLGPEQFGVLNYALAFVGLFAVFSSMGLENLSVKEMVSHPKEAKIILLSSFVLRLSAATIGLFVLWSFASFESDKTKLYAILILSLSLITNCFETFDFWFQAQTQSKPVAIARIGASLATSILKVIFILIDAPLLWLVSLFLFESFTTALLLTLVFRHRQSSDNGDLMYDVEWIKRLARAGAPLALSSIAIAIYSRIDQVMIGNLLDATQGGVYAAAVKISEIWYFIPSILVTTTLPAIMNALQTQTLNEAQFKIQKLFDLLAILAYSLALPTMFLSEWIVLSLYGTGYSDSASVLTIYIWCALFVFLGGARQIWLIANNLQMFALYATVAGALANIALNFVFIPHMGIKGAAYATLISMAISAYFSGLCSSKTRPIFWQQTQALIAFTFYKKLIVKVKSLM
jgi:PST family polysaccharide transporter